ncbi:tyrosine-type recombinase/integrase [Mesorhizobium captivum]|uniref:tyrosine-type recombinase/integrase n=1 Tax=Mesorhizobium captivum TaxID=3072319 RepID=UPI002A243E9E|nr:tyrosine-type recombinase/integrase [Mesorhizobium sp. VK23E]MDX8513591.1 tyrosine-type recombinase/integrase [Mesorhizobium sp. VK23E]
MDDVATIDLPYIEKNKSRHGRMRYYFRYEGARICRLPDDPDSEAFSVAYWEERNKIDGGATPAPKPTVRTLPGHPLPNSFRWLCMLYMKSDAFMHLDETTRTKRRQIIDSMLLEPVKKDSGDIFADMPIRALSVDNIQKLRDRKADTPFAADERLKILCQVFETTKPGRDGKPEPIMKVNTARLVRRFRKKTDGHQTITGAEIRQYFEHHGIDSKAVLGLALLMYVGFRVSDLQAIGPRHRRGDTFLFRVFKGRNRHPTTLEVPIHPSLAYIISLHKVAGLYYMMTEYGKPFSIKGLGQRVSEWFNQADLPHLSAHSVRKGLATNLAENETTDSMLDGLFGWKDGKTSKIYTARKQQSRLARQAVQRIEWAEIGNILPHLNEDGSVPAATPTEIMEQNQHSSSKIA